MFIWRDENKQKTGHSDRKPPHVPPFMRPQNLSESYNNSSNTPFSETLFLARQFQDIFTIFIPLLGQMGST